MGFTEVMVWIGQMRALVGLVTAVVVCIVFWIAAMYVMFTKNQFGKGVLLIVLGAALVALAALWYHIVMRSQTMAMLNGFVGVADALDGGRS